jgi:hypothetical protein
VYLFGAAFTATVPTGVDGRYFLPGLPAGTYTLVSQATGSGAVVAHVVNGQTTTADITVGAGRIQGRVTTASGGSAAGAPVLLIDPSGAFSTQFGATDQNGNYEFTAITLGLPYTVRAGHPTNPLALSLSAPVVVATDGQTATVNLTLPAVATVRVTVLDSDGVTPVPFPFISIDRDDGNGFQALGYGDFDGVAIIENAAGDFTVRAADDTGILGTVSGTVAPSADGTIIDVTITATGGLARLRGTAFAADGLTPLPEDDRVVIELVDVVSGAVIMQQSRGEFDFNVRVGNDHELTLQARSPLDPTAVVPLGFAMLVSPGNDYAGLDLYLPVPVVSGVVFQSDGFVVPFPSVGLTLTAGDGTTETFFATRTTGGGDYGIPVLRLGEFELTAQDPDSGLSATVTGSIVNATDIVQQDVVLAEGGSINGVVVENGAAVPFAEVTVISGSVTRTTFGSQAGLFGLGSVPAGPVRLRACNSQGACSSQLAFVEAGTTLPVTLSIEYGSVYGWIYDDLGNPVEGATVSVYNRADGSLPTGVSTTSTESGFFSLNNVPAGEVTVVAFAQGANTGGLTETFLDPFGNAFAEVYLEGRATKFDHQFDWQFSDFVVTCNGGLRVGQDGLTPADTSALQFAAQNGPTHTFPCLPFARLDSSETPVLDAGYVDGVGLDVGRRMSFVRAGGGVAYLRYLEVLTNRGPSDITVRVRLTGTLPDEGTTLTRTPAQTDNTYAVYGQFGAGLGLVFSGFDPPTPVQQTFDVHGYSYEWIITIPAGETRRLVHYVVHGEGGSANNTAGVLASQVDGSLLDELTAEELATIVNFRIQ